MVVDWSFGWPAHAACLGDLSIEWDWDMQTARVTSVCGRCPVRVPCLMTALERKPEDDVGIWGGTNPQERRDIRRGLYEPWDIWATHGYPCEEAESA